MIITPGGKQDICFANIASPGGDFIFHKKRKRRNGKREESLPKNVFFYSFRVLILFVVRFLLKVARDSSNLEEMLCVLWALSLIECVTVGALKLPVPPTDVLKPMRHKVFNCFTGNSKETNI